LEGRAEEVGVLRGEGEGEWGGAGGEEEFVYTVERRNVFDDEVMDLSSVRVGKKRFVCLHHTPVSHFYTFSAP
jgi:hypothetical protein